MRFRWRRNDRQVTRPAAHSAAPEAPPQLTHQQVLEALQSRLAEHFGPNGRWSLVRRSDDDTDVIFQESFTQALSRELAESIVAAPEQAAAPVDWKPQPIAIWAEPVQSDENTASPERHDRIAA